MSKDNLSKEQEIMLVMRKTLTHIIRDTTPEPGMKGPFSDAVVEDIKMCLRLISLREKELLSEKGVENTERPHYVDEPRTSDVVHFIPKK